MKNGFLLLHKERGLRSTACVNSLRKILGRQVKVGHAGTLDSTAEGLLILLFGKMTRASQYVMSLSKTYEVTAVLGMETDTLDNDGRILATSDTIQVSQDDISRCLASFTGWIRQRPPRISAVRIGGKRAHELTRAGDDVVLPARPVYLSRVKLVEYRESSATARLAVTCGKGTYIRSLVRDLGRMLGTFATVARLKRTAIGPFRVLESVKAGELDEKSLASEGRGPEGLAEAFPCYVVPEELADRLGNGNALQPARLQRRHWGVQEDNGIVILKSEKVFSFARSTQIAGETLFKPETNIFIGEEQRQGQ
jgi:tRNA pseudouridine(55) synthase